MNRCSIAIISTMSTTVLWSCAPADPGGGVDVSQFVVGPAAANLDSNGHFQLDVHPVGDEISREMAEAQATLWARDFAPSIRDALELGHQGQIDIGALKVCGTTWYANTAFQPVDPGVPGPVVRSAGSWWLVGLCQRGAIAVSLAVAARSDATIANDHLVFPDSSGNDFFPQGIPSSWDGSLPASPENAVIDVARATGLRISQVPRLVARPLSFVEPQGAMWQIIVEQPVTLHGRISGRSVTLDTLYYGLTGPVGTALTPSVAIPEADQPVSVTVTLGGTPPRMFTLLLRAGTPTLFERIAPTQ